MKNSRQTTQNTKIFYQKHALFLTLIFLLLTAVSLVWIGLQVRQPFGQTAEIYQEGQLIRSIDLSTVTESYTFTVTAENGGTNVIEVRPGAIGILSADCPDKLCVRQGFINNSLLPVTCLPNRLVIQIKDNAAAAGQASDFEEATPDIITY